MPLRHYRVVGTALLVLALHAAGVCVLLKDSSPTVVSVPIARVITAQLLSAQLSPASHSVAVAPVPPVLHAQVPPVAREKPAEHDEPRPQLAAPTLPVHRPPREPVRNRLPAKADALPRAAAVPVAPAPAAAVNPLADASSRDAPVLELRSAQERSHLDCQIVSPSYPIRSKRLGESGTAYVHFVVGLTGRIEQIEIKQSSGFDRLDAAAVEAMHASSCKPFLRDGVPIRASYTQPFTFNFDH